MISVAGQIAGERVEVQGCHACSKLLVEWNRGVPRDHGRDDDDHASIRQYRNI